MKKENINHKIIYYRMVKTRETANGESVFMYGIEGFGGNGSVSLVSLSTDRERIIKLVKILNESGLELGELKNTVDKFLCECYGDAHILKK